MEEIAQVYSRSLFEVAKEQGKLDEVKEQLGQFSDALEGDRELAVFFFSPYFSTPEKQDGLKKLVDGMEPILLNFLDVLIENHRLPAIHRIRRQYDALWDKEMKILPVEVTSAVELDEGTVQHLGDRIGEQTGRRVQLTSTIDPDILGGIVLRVGNSILDASIRSRLNQLRREVAKA
jgi:F-type H+-transporting ATPase subunit delta